MHDILTVLVYDIVCRACELRVPSDPAACAKNSTKAEKKEEADTNFTLDYFTTT
jgi:hypothetical protein